MPKACEHGLKLSECFTCASPKTGASPIPPASERERFERELKGLDFTKSADGWGRETYHHPHVQSIWYGWQARAALSNPSTQGWKDMAYAKLGAVRDKMTPQHVDAVQRFLRDECAAPPPPEQGGKG